MKTSEHMAKATGKSLSISTKHSIEVCNYLRNKLVDDAKVILKDAIEGKKAIPFKRFCNGAGHKTGIASGKFPVNACKEILRLLEAIEANAQYKGLNTSSLKITTIKANQAARPWHYGRMTRRKMKRTHIDIIVEETVKKDKKDVKKKTHKKKTTKEVKKSEEVKQVEKKAKETTIKKEPVKQQIQKSGDKQ